MPVIAFNDKIYVIKPLQLQNNECYTETYVGTMGHLGISGADEKWVIGHVL